MSIVFIRYLSNIMPTPYLQDKRRSMRQNTPKRKENENENEKNKNVEVNGNNDVSYNIILCRTFEYVYHCIHCEYILCRHIAKIASLRYHKISARIRYTQPNRNTYIYTYLLFVPSICFISRSRTSLHFSIFRTACISINVNAQHDFLQYVL